MNIYKQIVLHSSSSCFQLKKKILIWGHFYGFLNILLNVIDIWV